MFTIFLYVAALGSLLYTFRRDRMKTKKSIMVAKKSFLNILPELTAIFLLVAIVLAIVPPAAIRNAVGGQSGFAGMSVSALIGSFTLIPGFVAFPLAKSLLDLGAGMTQVIVFISTLMMVGIVTLPLEIRYFGKKQSLLRNGIAFIYSFIAAFLVWRLM